MTPQISIIIPVYNAALTLEKCVTSIIYQSFSDFEVLLVNDGSADNSLEVMQRLAALDSRIIAIDKPHTGVSETRNLALQRARGECICFVDGDDTIEPNYLSSMYAHHECDMVICGYFVDWYSADGLLSRREVQTLPQIGRYDISAGCDVIYELFAKGKMHINCNKLLKKSIIDQYNLRYSPIPVNEDYMFMVEYLKHSNTIFAVDAVTYHWIRIKGNTTGVDSIPYNLPAIYMNAYDQTVSLFRDKTLVNNIFYYTFELLVRKYLTAEKRGSISKEESRKILSYMFTLPQVKNSLMSHQPAGMGELFMILLLRLKFFGIYQIFFIK